MQILTSLRDEVLYVRVEGAEALVQHNAQYLKDAVLKEMSGGPALVVIDCGGLKGIDSAGAGALITILKAVRKRNGRMGLLHVTAPVRTILGIVRLTSVLEIFESEASAAAAFSISSRIVQT